MNRSRLIWLRRNTSGITFIIAIIYQLLVAVPKNSLQFLFRGKFAHFRAYVKAWGWHFKHFNNKELHINSQLTQNSGPA